MTDEEFQTWTDLYTIARESKLENLSSLYDAFFEEAVKRYLAQGIATVCEHINNLTGEQKDANR